MKTQDLDRALAFAEKWARHWLIQEADAAEGHVLRRNMVIDEALSPAPPPSEGEINWDDLPMFGYPDGIPRNFDDAKGKKLIKRAISGDVDADGALCAIALKYIYFGKRMPTTLGAYICHVLERRLKERGPRRRGADPYVHVARNMYIVGTVARLSLEGFSPTRNKARKEGARESGCSIVTKALTKIGMSITEDGVEEVWASRDKFGFPRKPDNAARVPN
jgi:hypothetical protein